MAKWTGKRTSVTYTKPAEPSFLKAFKERVGYKEDGGLSDKFATMPNAADDDIEDKDDELPQVVSLKAGDLSQEEYERLRSEGKLDDLLNDEISEVQGPMTKDEEPPQEGRILFRKPTKRTSEDGPQEDPKKLKSDEKSEKPNKKKKKEKQKLKLLSFNEDEDEEDL